MTTHPLIRHLRAAAAAVSLAVAAVASSAEAPERFTASGPGTDQFGPAPGLSCPRSGGASALDYELKKISDKVKQPEAKEEGRLCAAAESLLAWDPAKGETPPPQVMTFLSNHVGLPTPVKRVVIVSLDIGQRGSGTEENKALAEALRKPIGETLIDYQQPRWGMATDRIKKGVYKVVVVMDDRALEVDQLPRKLAAGQTAPLSGKVLPPYQNPKLTISDERGQITKPEPTPGVAFKGELRCGSTPGDLWVDVQAERDGRSTPVGAFSVACGKDLPTSVALSTAAWPPDVAGQERRLGEGINAQREAIGVGRLEWDDKLAGAARRVAETIRDQVNRGESPTVDTAKALEKAELAFPVVLQNAAQTRSAEEAEQRFTASPTNRQNILNPEVNRVGIGIAPSQDPSGKPVVLVVELFTKALGKIDPQAVKRDLYAAVEKRRAEAGVTAAAADPKLEKVAQEYAEAMAGSAGKLSQDDANEVTHGIRIAYKSIDMIDGRQGQPPRLRRRPDRGLARHVHGRRCGPGRPPGAREERHLRGAHRGHAAGAGDRQARPEAQAEGGGEGEVRGSQGVLPRHSAPAPTCPAVVFGRQRGSGRQDR